MIRHTNHVMIRRSPVFLGLCAVIGAAAGGIVALVEGVQGTDCLNATVSGCGAPNHSARDIGLGAVLGAVIGAMMGYALHH